MLVALLPSQPQAHAVWDVSWQQKQERDMPVAAAAAAAVVPCMSAVAHIPGGALVHAEQLFEAAD